MENKLLKSFIVLIIFYLFVSVVFWLVSLGDLDSIKAYFLSDGEISFWEGFSMAFSTFYSWTFPVLSGFFLLSLFSFGFYYFVQHSKQKKKKRNLKGGNFNDIRTTLGPLPRPEWIVKSNSEINLKFDKRVDIIFSSFDKVYQDLFKEVISVLDSYPDSFVGAGHMGTLLDHTIHVLMKAVDSGNHAINDPLSFIAIASHDVGKVLVDNEIVADKFWCRNGHHDEFGGLIVSTLPSYLKLPFAEQRLLTIVLKYSHKPNRAPKIKDEIIFARYNALKSLVSVSDKSATKTEKEELLAEMSVPEIFERIFWQAVQNCRYMSKTTAAGIQVDAFRFSKNRILLVENKFREKLLLEMTDVERAVFNEGRRAKKQLSKVTVELIKYLKIKGYVVSSYTKKDEEDNDVTYTSSSSLWNVKSGTLDLKGMLLLEIPEDKVPMISNDEPRYKLEISGPTKLIVPGQKKDKKKPKPKAQNAAKRKEDLKPRVRNKKVLPENQQKPEDNQKNNPEKALEKKLERPLSDEPKPVENNSSEVKNPKGTPPSKGPQKPLSERALERRTKHKTPSKEEKNIDEALVALKKREKEIAIEAEKRIKIAEERIADKTLSYEEAKIELDYLVSQKVLEVTSPYYQAILSHKSPSDPKSKVKVKKENNLKNSRHMAMVTSSVMGGSAR